MGCVRPEYVRHAGFFEQLGKLEHVDVLADGDDATVTDKLGRDLLETFPERGEPVRILLVMIADIYQRGPGKAEIRDLSPAPPCAFALLGDASSSSTSTPFSSLFLLLKFTLFSLRGRVPRFAAATVA